MARSQEEFEAACEITFLFWKMDARLFSFAEYFEKEWGPSSKHCGWYEGFSKRQPSSNNGPESKHRWFKTNKLRGLRKNIQLMLARSLDTVDQWSKELDDNICEAPAMYKFVDLAVETAAWQYLNGASRPRYVRLDFATMHRVFFLVVPEDVAHTYPVNIAPLVDMLRARAWPTFPFQSFQSYRECRMSVWLVEWDTQSDLWNCSCIPWVKHKICKHEVALKVVIGKHVFSANASDIPVGEKRKRGRPAAIPRKQPFVKDTYGRVDPNYLSMSLLQPQQLPDVELSTQVAATSNDSLSLQLQHSTSDSSEHEESQVECLQERPDYGHPLTFAELMAEWSESNMTFVTGF